MNIPAKRISVAIASMAVIGGAVLGADGGSSAATLTPEHTQSQAVSAEAKSHPGSHSDNYRGNGNHSNDYRGDRNYSRWDRSEDQRCNHGVSHLRNGSRDWRNGGARDEVNSYTTPGTRPIFGTNVAHVQPAVGLTPLRRHEI
ncbi:hypothetical protein ACIHCV_45870 [Streptomyces sp. NPDC051956]|uniref:hypothetical protein n=1 Tax=Streptomyces sp. NPDC051956 TaxID=3365677 RepID=UPI0037CF4469